MAKKPKTLTLLQRSNIAEDISLAGPTRDLCIKCGLWSALDKHGRPPKRPGTGPFVPANYTGNVLMVGEAFGADEDERTGRPFTGRSGVLIKEEAERAGYAVQEVAWDNANKCRPPDNATPTLTQIRCCRPFLLDTIQKLQPKVIIALGVNAAKALYNKGDASVVQERGRPGEVWYGDKQNGPQTTI